MDYPHEIKLLIAQCEANVSSFDNNQMSEALHYGQSQSFEVSKLTAIMRYVAANTRDKWARDYLVARLINRGHDATLVNPIKTNSE